MKIFWSWQSDTPGRIGRHFVRGVLEEVVETLKQLLEVDEPTEREARSTVHLDHDRKGVGGSPDLARVILEKIAQSVVFVADVTPVGVVHEAPGDQSSSVVKKIINSNVAIELGYALHALTDRSLLMVMNEHYGNRSDLPFDLQAKSGPILFNLPPDANKESIGSEARSLKAKLLEAVELCLLNRRAPSATNSMSLFQLSVGENGQFLRTESKDIYSIKRTFNLRVDNIDARQNLAHCKLSILSIEPQTEYQGPWVLKDEFGLAAGESIFVPIVRYGEAREPDKFPCSNSFFVVLTESAGVPKLDIDSEHVLTIRATSPRTAFQDFKFKVWVESSRLRIANLTPLVIKPEEARKIVDELGRQRTRETELRNLHVGSDAEFELEEAAYRFA